MSDYQERLKNEYTELRNKYIKLNTFICKNPYECIGNTPMILLKQQKYAMKRYLDILEKRLILEGVDFS